MREKLFALAFAASSLLAPGAQAQPGDAKPFTAPEVFASPLSLLQSGGGYLGVYLADVKSEERVKELKLSEMRGAVVGKVVEGSPAAKAGLKENDVILSFDEEAVRSANHVHRLLVETPPGRSVALKISRGGVEQTVKVTLGERGQGGMSATLIQPGGLTPGFPQKMPGGGLTPLDSLRPEKPFGDGLIYFDAGASRYRLGVRVVTLSEQLATYFGVKNGGLLVTEVEPGGLAERAGLKAGDCVTAVNGERVTSASDLAGAMRRAGKAATKEEGKPGEAVTLTVVRERKEQAIKVEPEESKS